MSKSPIIASIANSKGVCGKSTMTMFLAAALAKEKNKKVLIVDTDEQRTITDIWEGEKASGGCLPIAWKRESTITMLFQNKCFIR